jgi:hypothetical protein
MTVDLNTCVPGQKVRTSGGNIVIYQKKDPGNSWYPHVVNSSIYADDGSCYYYSEEVKSFLDIVEILPLETTESTKSDQHPSVAWWESCPWITDRKPTKEDGKPTGWVVTKVIGSSDLITTSWSKIEVGRAWIHRPDWQPPVLSNKEKALELLNKHKDGVTMCVWIPTSEDWTTILKGLEE